MRLLLISCLSFFTTSLFALTLVEDFSSIAHLDTANSTGVWNAALRRLHVPFVVDKNFGGFTEDTLLNVGAASHGAFSSATMYQHDLNHGSTPGVVRLSTTSNWQFSTFTLPQGITLKAVGSSPLIIRVQGDVSIAGRVDLRGTSGGEPETSASSTATGGSGVAGGGNGGTGGNPTSPATDGLGSGAGRLGDVNIAGFGGAGGGGGFVSGMTAGANGTGGASGGAAGTTYGDSYFDESTILGGSGGGGAGGSGGKTYPAGGGGGGGGGAMVLTAGGNIVISSTGSILAYGGDGGVPDDSNAECASGGGGAGGAVVLFAGGLITNNGILNARGGFGGGGECQVEGGNGSVGRARFVDSSATLSAHGSPQTENPNPTNSGTPWGQIFSSTAVSYVIQSLSYDTQNSSPTYEQVALDSHIPTGSTFTFEVAGSSDNFQSDDTGFVDTSLLSTLSGKRYVKFRLTLQATSEVNPPYLSSIALQYAPKVPDTFKVKQSCSSIHWERAKGGRMTLSKEGELPTAIWFFVVLGYLLSLSFLLPAFLRRIQSSTSEVDPH